MTKEEIISKVTELNLPKDSYIVFGSCPLAIAGLRESGDIDMLVTTELFEKLRADGWKEIEKGPNNKPLTHDCFEAHDNWNVSSYNPTLEDLLKNVTEVQGIPFASLEDVYKWKVASGREKDLKDIELMQKHGVKVEKS